jgi:hypothetical protein
VVAPARQAYSHSASLGSRYDRPVMAARRRQNSSAGKCLGILPRQSDRKLCRGAAGRDRQSCGSEDVGGGFGSGAVQAVRKSLTQRVQISADELKRQIGNLMAIVGDVFDQSRAETGMVLDGIELSIEISSEGQISILGSGGKLEGKGGIKFSFRRNPAKV